MKRGRGEAALRASFCTVGVVLHGGRRSARWASPCTVSVALHSAFFSLRARPYPLSKMMGGKIKRKKEVGSKASTRAMLTPPPSMETTTAMAQPAKRAGKGGGGVGPGQAGRDRPAAARWTAALSSIPTRMTATESGRTWTLARLSA